MTARSTSPGCSPDQVEDELIAALQEHRRKAEGGGMIATRTRRAPATPDEIRAMIRMRLEHHSWPEIAARFGYAASGASARAAAMKFAPAAGDERLLDAMRGIRGYPPRRVDDRERLLACVPAPSIRSRRSAGTCASTA